MSRRAKRHPPEGVKLRMWLSEPVGGDVKLALQRIERADDVRRVAVMPDVHLAGAVCIGTVVGTRRLVYPQAVGADIGCGMAAVAFDCDVSLLARESRARQVLVTLRETVPVMRHRSRQSAPPLPESLLTAGSLSSAKLVSAAQREGQVEFGTLGRGNHFLEFQGDEDQRLWLMVHSGSRVMGQLITESHLQYATKGKGGLVHLDAGAPMGRAYLSDVSWALRYADASRRAMVDAVTRTMHRLFKADAVSASLLCCDHNHVRREEHFGEAYWIHRKGAISAMDGEPGIIPGSMGTRSYHVVGRGCADALSSSSHGAGRAMSREQARRRLSVKQVYRELEGIWFDERLAAGLREETPSAYKDIDAIMRAQKKLTRIVRRLHPVLCYKGA